MLQHEQMFSIYNARSRALHALAGARGGEHLLLTSDRLLIIALVYSRSTLLLAKSLSAN